MKLDAKTVGSLQLPAGKTNVIYFDEDLPGFGLRLRTGGRQTWIAQYRLLGKSRRLTIGNPAVLTATEARKAAKVALAKVAMGQDPLPAKVQDQSTFRSLVESYLDAREGKLRPRSILDMRRYLTGPYVKPLHAMPVESITRRHVAEQILRIERANGMGAARRARATLSGLFTWAMRCGLVENNPLIGCYRTDDPIPRKRVLSDDELIAIWRACGDDDFGKIVRLLILTAQRRSEVGGLAWSEVDLDRGIWTLPAERSKNDLAHSVPLIGPALEIIRATPQVVGRDKLFGARASAGFVRWSAHKLALDAQLGDAVAPWILHDIRRTVATGMANIGVAPHVIEAVLNHQSGSKSGVAGVYNRSSYEAEKRVALARWDDHLRALVEGGAKKVLLLRR